MSKRRAARKLNDFHDGTPRGWLLQPPLWGQWTRAINDGAGGTSAGEVVLRLALDADDFEGALALELLRHRLDAIFGRAQLLGEIGRAEAALRRFDELDDLLLQRRIGAPTLARAAPRRARRRSAPARRRERPRQPL